MCYKCDNLSAYLLSVTSINNNTHNMRKKICWTDSYSTFQQKPRKLSSVEVAALIWYFVVIHG